MTVPDGRMVEVRGIVRYDRAEVPPGPVLVRVRLEDVSQADAAAEPIAEQAQVVDLSTLDGELPFAVAAPASVLDEPMRDLVVRVHVDVGDTGRVAAGDLVSTRSTPVGAHAEQITVDIRRV